MSVLSGNVLLTGATGGIGEAIARTLAARGADLLISGRREEALRPLAEELGARWQVCDLGQRDQLQGLVAAAGEVDLLVANAALPASGLLLERSEEQIDLDLEVNLRAPIILARRLAPGMVSRRRGHLVFISSLAGRAASPASAMYSATKFGLRGFALGLRADLHEHAVGVSVVSPGFIREAGMFHEARIELPRGVGTRSPQDVAEGVVRAVEGNRAEVDVAPVGLRVGASIAAVAPGIAGRISRRLGSDRIAVDLAAGQAGRQR